LSADCRCDSKSYCARAPEGRPSLAHRFSGGKSGKHGKSPEGRPSSHPHASKLREPAHFQRRALVTCPLFPFTRQYDKGSQFQPPQQSPELWESGKRRRRMPARFPRRLYRRLFHSSLPVNVSRTPSAFGIRSQTHQSCRCIRNYREDLGRCGCTRG
jgi:hypothetical protein